MQNNITLDNIILTKINETNLWDNYKRTNNKGRCLQSEHYGRVTYGLVQQR